MNSLHFSEIVDHLVALKDTSELMLDLSYSSILLNSRELAEEVQKLEEYMDDLHTKFELLVLASCLGGEGSKDFLGLIRLGVVTEQIADAASDLAEVVLRELEPHQVLKLAIEEAEETVTSATISPNSPVKNKTLKFAKVADETGMWILVIKRGSTWLRPRPGIKLLVGDVLIASGYAEGENDFKRLVEGSEKNEKSI